MSQMAIYIMPSGIPPTNTQGVKDMTHRVAVAEILGGKRVLGREVTSLKDLQDILLAGLPY